MLGTGNGRLAPLALVFAAGPALAHQGHHGQLDLLGLVSHFFQTDHLVFAGLAVLTGIVAFRAGRRAEARARATRRPADDPR